jgi:tripartite-type tricarboxylate transporter receptor subunit TctC
LLVPFPAGGTLDVLARVLAPSLERLLAQDVVVMNVPGAAGRIACARAARSEPDGNTLLLGTSATHAAAQALFPDLPYRPEQDFIGAGCICATRFVLVASPGLRVRSLADLVRVAHATSEPLLYGSWGVGSGGHITVEAMRRQVGIALTHVPFQSIETMMQPLLEGQMPLGISSVGAVATWLQQKRVVPVLVSGTSPAPWMPDVGTFAQAGGPVAPEAWCALFAPRQTPDTVVARLEAALLTALKEPGVTKVLETLWLEPLALDRARFQALWHEDIAGWRRVVLEAGIRLD